MLKGTAPEPSLQQVILISLVVTARDSPLRGYEIESRQQTLDGHIFTLICAENVARKFWQDLGDTENQDVIS